MNKLLFFFALINLLIICWCDKGKTELKDTINIGINDKTLKEYEGQFPLPNGMSFNSYLIIDEKILIINGVEKKYEDEWLKNLQHSLGNREPDYILIQHMELDSSESLVALVKKYPKVKIVSSKKSFILMKKYFKEDFSKNSQEVKEGDELTLGKHTLHFISAPMIHWPDVLLTFDAFTQSLFSCDIFGTFGTNDVEAPWDDEGRRFYYSVIGKYGEQVQSLLKKLSEFQIKNILPNHGPALSENLDHYLSLYDKWSKYLPEEEGVVIAYSSIHGNTKVAVDKLVEKLKSLGVKFIIHNLSFSHVSNVVSDAFKYTKLVLASVTYHDGIYPFMRVLLNFLVSRNYQSRQVSIIENYSWKPNHGSVLLQKLRNCKNLDLSHQVVSINSGVKKDDIKNLEALAEQLSKK